MSDSSFRRVFIRKEALKFSAAHMTVFEDGSKEALHGHNYRTELTIDLASTVGDRIIPFHEFKKALKGICAQWDEKVLLAERCPHFKVLKNGKESKDELDFTLCGKHYVLPRDEVELLPLTNIVTETLAEELCKRLLQALGPERARSDLKSIEVKVEEITGQGASFVWCNPGK